MKNKIMSHIVAGYPNLKECEEIIIAMAEVGVSFIEIQMPFSDPIADGPTIMEANEKALSNGIKTEDCFRLIQRLNKKIKTPILIMTYFNIPFRYGLEKFCRKAKECGIYGLIIPDIPIDEEKYENYLGKCKKYKLNAIQVISPLTTERRLKLISKNASGFVYCVSVFGTTGTRVKLGPDIAEYIKKVKKYIRLPLALGFGISSRNQVAEALKYADIAVIGSKIINILKLRKGHKSIAIKKFLGRIV